MKWSMTICFVVFSSLAWGVLDTSFDNPPETNPNITWETQYPDYQRNILLDFSTDPIATPGNGIPGAIYDGIDDPVLWESDFVEVTGDVVWDADKQALGLFDAPAGGASGSIIIHVDNWERPWPVKHIYEEIFFTVEGGVSHLYVDYLNLPDGYDEGPWWGDSTLGQPGPDHWVQYWVEVKPNPPWEEIVILIDTPEGGSIYLNNLHIATECIPEPATMVLLGLGSLMSVISRKHRT